MHGNLNEIDIRSILQLIELGQRTGELFVETYTSRFGSASSELSSRTQRVQSWLVFFLNGQIAYAANGDGSLVRLRDHMHRYQVEADLYKAESPAIASTNAPEYGYLWNLLKNRILTPAQGRSIIQSMVHETLFDLLSLRQGSFIFEIDPALAPQLITLEIAPLVTKIVRQIQEWKQFHPHIRSPDQCPALSETEQLRSALSENAFNTLYRRANGTTSLRQMARHLNRDILTVAKAIYPYVQKGWVQLLPAPSEESSISKLEFKFWPKVKIPHVVCIDDGITVCEVVEGILNQHGYKATAIVEPLEALSKVFKLKPDLILCDIEMPELNGYEICAMLRTSTVFRQVPIVMLTSRDGFIDRVKARMVGATDYLTKPFIDNELLMLVEKYVGPGSE